jgi:predicted transglutaminase-like cysteine proteinase
MGWTKFADELPRDADLDRVNDRVNERIEPREADTMKPWRIVYGDNDYAKDGCCHDYSVTKRSELLGLGWLPSRLLLAEVAYSAKEDHMVLIAVDSAGVERVLDNLRPDIVTWAECGYRLVRRQTAANPDLWEVI